MKTLRKRTNEPVIHSTCLMYRSTHKAITTFAKFHDKSFSAFLEEVLIEYLEDHKEELAVYEAVTDYVLSERKKQDPFSGERTVLLEEER